jgi:hypothetical protein
MFILVICVYLMHARQWSWSPIPSGIHNSNPKKQGIHPYDKLPATKTILLFSAEGLEKLLPTVTCVVPVYEPIIVALMIGCIALAGCNLQGSNSNKFDGIDAVEDAA